MNDSPMTGVGTLTAHCFTPSWCKCPDEPMCRLCKQGRCPVDEGRGLSEVTLPNIGQKVCLRWAGRWVYATVVEHKGGTMLDLDHNGITLLSVGYDRNGWQWSTPKGEEVTDV